MPRRHSSTSKQRIAARELERHAFALRKAGATYEQIGRQLGVSKVAAHKAVKRVLERTAAEMTADVESVRALEASRLDELLMGLWQRARSGDYEAIDRALRIMQRRAGLLGLDAPKSYRAVVSHEEELEKLR